LSTSRRCGGDQPGLSEVASVGRYRARSGSGPHAVLELAFALGLALALALALALIPGTTSDSRKRHILDLIIPLFRDRLKPPNGTDVGLVRTVRETIVVRRLGLQTCRLDLVRVVDVGRGPYLSGGEGGPGLSGAVGGRDLVFQADRAGVRGGRHGVGPEDDAVGPWGVSGARAKASICMYTTPSQRRKDRSTKSEFRCELSAGSVGQRGVPHPLQSSARKGERLDTGLVLCGGA
jgi:hypothetical protein